MKIEEKDGRYAVELGDTYSYFSHYSMNQTLKGAKAHYRKDTGMGNGTLNINATSAVAFPLTVEGSMLVTYPKDGSVKLVINFDAATSFSGLTYVDNDGGVGNGATLTGLAFDPIIAIA